MSSLAFILISIVEYIGVLVAILALFRYPVTHYWPQIVFTSFFCSILSYIVMILYDLTLAPIIQMFFLALCFWLLFDTPLIWSFVLCSFGIVYAVFQGIVMVIAVSIGFATPASLENKMSIEIYTVQIVCAVVCFFLGMYWQRKRIGFLFVPTSREAPFDWSKMNRQLVFISLASFLSMSSMSIAYACFSLSNVEWFIGLLAMLAVVSILLLTTMKRKDLEYADQSWNH
ncbi:hypothetical protein [Cohnella laeviribosi]|uniref:hypothetical protein n=1 Tax=Cohnella laeviribosi TaxID=380174 RepID=UPI00036C5A2E|nr:hypothetical protein [Cohnella laeviribosi]